MSLTSCRLCFKGNMVHIRVTSNPAGRAVSTSHSAHEYTRMERIRTDGGWTVAVWMRRSGPISARAVNDRARDVAVRAHTSPAPPMGDWVLYRPQTSRGANRSAQEYCAKRSLYTIKAPWTLQSWGIL